MKNGRKPYTPKDFWKKVNVGKEDECWEWKGRCRHARYGFYGEVGYNCKKWGTHRLAYILTYGEDIPEGMFVCHKCDNTRCCNPNHLFLGTHQDNMDDMVRKGRKQKGEACHLSKLTEEDVRQIRQVYIKGIVGYGTIGKQFGVDRDTIKEIVTYETWKHIP